MGSFDFRVAAGCGLVPAAGAVGAAGSGAGLFDLNIRSKFCHCVSATVLWQQVPPPRADLLNHI